MPERFEIYIVYKRQYINTLPFLSFLDRFIFRTGMQLLQLFVLAEVLAIQVQLHSFLNCSCTAEHDKISRIQIYSFKVD